MYNIYRKLRKEFKDNRMIEYGACDKAELIEVIEALAYKILHYEHPTWYEIPEEEVINLLKNEGLSIIEF